MAGIDKAAIVVVIAVLAVFLGIVLVLSTTQDTVPIDSAPIVSKTIEQVKSPAADKAAADKAAADKAAADKAAADKAAADKAAADKAAADKAAADKAADPQTHTVNVPTGSSVPGCEETNSCFTPANITINAGDTVEWNNIDTAAHTVTSGSPSDGPSGVFDSSLLMADATFTFTFEDAGEYDYFCMVHPWMVGSVSVN